MCDTSLTGNEISREKRIKKKTYTEATAVQWVVVVVDRVIEIEAPGRRALRGFDHSSVAINSLNYWKSD